MKKKPLEESRLPETYQWLLVPGQSSPAAAVEWQAFRLAGQDALAVRVSKKLKNDELLVVNYAPLMRWNSGIVVCGRCT